MSASTKTSLAASALAALRGEIDTLDDALHDLLMRRAAVVARLAESRAKGHGSPLRPGREAQILRRLLARHAGPLPPAALVRLWREILSTSSAMQNRFVVALPSRDPALATLAREHFGTLTPQHIHPGPAAALAALAAGEAQLAVLPLPEEDEPAGSTWWPGLDAPTLQVVARLPFWSAGPGPEALAVALGPPDPSGDDRSLLRLEWSGEAATDYARIAAALASAGLPPRRLLLRRDGSRLRALAELDGVVEAGDPRLTRLSVDHAQPLGFYAIPCCGPDQEETA